MTSVLLFDKWHLLLTFLATLGFIGSSYEFYARHRGWPVGASFPRLATGSIVMVPLAIGIIWYYRNWLAALIALVLGFVLAWLLTVTLRQRVQTLWAVSMLGVIGRVGWLLFARFMG
jgi:hypothetical protein